MNARMVQEIADAVLYEGYLLYPYRASALKNRRRFTFGVLAPRAECEAGAGDNWFSQTECLARVDPGARLTVRVRFLHLSEPVDPQTDVDWQEATARDIDLSTPLAAVLTTPLEQPFSLPARIVRHTSGSDSSGNGEGHDGNNNNNNNNNNGYRDSVAAPRRESAIEGCVDLAVASVGDALVRITLRVSNVTVSTDAGATGAAGGTGAHESPRPNGRLMRSLVSAHAILRLEDGQFLSLMDPPDEASGLAAECRNIGVWPVLVGEAPAADAMLSSPIILYDYPQIAPQSPGDLFDGTEIDEILALRILTMTDAEKQEMRDGDPRGRQILERTERLSPDEWLRMHGIMREPRALVEDEPS